MSTAWASAFYTSTHWKKCRDGFISYKKGLCEECLKNGIIRSGTQVHHKIPLTQENITNPTIALSWNNLMLLCEPCHIKIHEGLKKKSGAKKHKRYTVSADGTVTARKTKE